MASIGETVFMNLNSTASAVLRLVVAIYICHNLLKNLNSTASAVLRLQAVVDNLGSVR